MGPGGARRALKRQAKNVFFQYAVPCVLGAFLLLSVTALTQIFSMVTGGGLYYTWLDTRQFPVESGVWQAGPELMEALLATVGLGEELSRLGGLVFSLRYEGLVLVLPLGWVQLIKILGIQALILLITAPLQMGVANQFYRILSGRPGTTRQILGWYSDLRLSGKALAVQVGLAVWRFVTSVACMAPSLLCLAVGSGSPHGEILIVLAPVLSLLGALGGFYLYLLLLPARYVLARSPQCSVPEAFSQGLRLLSGRQGAYLMLNLTLLPWQFASLFLWNIPSLFVIPYRELSNFLFLNPEVREEAVRL